MTYVATRTAVFLPEMTVDIRLDDKLILPNFAALVRTLGRLIRKGVYNTILSLDLGT